MVGKNVEKPVPKIGKQLLGEKRSTSIIMNIFRITGTSAHENQQA